ncbi:MAG: DUF2949 domain-containing protein [Microcoleaceae cyanobacterium]
MHGDRHDNHILRFLQEELSISTSEITVALRQFERSGGSLPIVLYQYGFVSLKQLSRIFDWQKHQTPICPMSATWFSSNSTVNPQPHPSPFLP